MYIVFGIWVQKIVQNNDEYILDSKRNAYFSISIEYQKPLSNLTLNDMNMFEWTHAFAPDHFIRNYHVLLINAKIAKKTVA